MVDLHRAAVLLMTLLSAILAGLFAWHDGYKVNLFAWFILHSAGAGSRFQ